MNFVFVKENADVIEAFIETIDEADAEWGVMMRMTDKYSQLRHFTVPFLYRGGVITLVKSIIR
jgi:hypothetical protein